MFRTKLNDKAENSSRVVALHTEENSATSPSEGTLYLIEVKTGIGCLDAETWVAKENNVRTCHNYFCWWLLVEVYNQREIFDIKRPDETNRRYLPLIREKKYCDAMRPPPLKTSGDDSEGRFQVIDDTVETESQPQASGESYRMTDPTNEEALRTSVNEVLRPADYGSYGTSSRSHATASNSYEAALDRTTSVPYTSSISADMPTEQDGYQKSQDCQNGYQRGYDEGYKSGYQKGIGAAQSSTVYDETYSKDYSISSYGSYNHEGTNSDTQDYPYHDSGHASTLATGESSYNQGDGTHDVYNTADTETRSTIVQDDDRYENKLERHGRSKKKSSRQ